MVTQRACGRSCPALSGTAEEAGRYAPCLVITPEPERCSHPATPSLNFQTCSHLAGLSSTPPYLGAPGEPGESQGNSGLVSTAATPAPLQCLVWAEGYGWPPTPHQAQVWVPDVSWGRRSQKRR